MLMVLKFLETIGHYNSPIGQLATQLAAESEAAGLLPNRIDYQGRIHCLSYTEALQRDHHLSPDLQALLSQHVHGGSLPSPLLLPRPLIHITRTLMDSPHLPTSRSTLIKQHLPYTNLAHLKTIRGHRRAVFSLALDPTQTFLVTGSEDALVKIWALRSGFLLASCRGHTESINDLSVSCNGKVCASASDDRSIRLWSLQHPTIGHPYEVGGLFGHQARVTRVVFHPSKVGGTSSVSSYLCSSSSIRVECT